MAKGISPQEAASRLSSAGIQFGERFTRGTSGKGQKWAAGAGAASASYAQGVQEAIAAGRFATGVQKAGGSAYDQGVQSKGATNWSTGMQTGGDKYAKNVAQAAALWNQPLGTPRGARRSPNNEKRMLENLQRFKQLRK